MPSFESVFHQIAAVLFLAAAVGVAARRLRQPLIVAFILTGLLVGPSGLGIVRGQEEITVLADIGIALLLFVVGLKLDLHLIRSVGPVALAAGLGQVAFTSVIGFGIALVLGLSTTAAAYVAVALTFSSTIIIVKLLSDKGEVEAPHGRIAMGILIVQDLVVVVIMIVLSAFGGDGGSLAVDLGRVLLVGAAFLAAIAVLMRWILPPLLHRLAQTPELLVLFAVAWAVALAAAGDALDFSEEVGAFLAGVSLASTQYRSAISARLVSLRDFLLLFFFIDLGARLEFTGVQSQVVPALVLSLFVLVGNPVIVMAITGFMGYPSKIGFRTGLTVAQISEFSLIFAALGLDLGHIDEEAVGLITTVGLITIALSTYAILGADGLYRRLEPVLGVFERNRSKDADFEVGTGPPPEVVLVGLGRSGRPLAERFSEAGIAVLAVEIDPELLHTWADDDVRTTYGDIEDPELLGSLPLDAARWIISTTADTTANLALLHAAQHHGFEGRVAVSAHGPEDGRRLEEAGADLVLLPFDIAADHVIEDLRRS
ncbi:MAG TPA: cation:proton antiporter family protein [Acidimicrobiales bacterium]|nr:cation:proton antiporter family protein [Acidimicrobiales bacterium]